MQYVIVTTQWCSERGIAIPEHAAKSLDGSQVLFHKEFIDPVILRSGDIKSYEHDDPALWEILNGPEWSEPIKEEETI